MGLTEDFLKKHQNEKMQEKRLGTWRRQLRPKTKVPSSKPKRKWIKCHPFLRMETLKKFCTQFYKKILLTLSFWRSRVGQYRKRKKTQPALNNIPTKLST